MPRAPRDQDRAATERVSEVALARDAVARRAWREAYDAFHALDPSTLAPQDLNDFAQAAWWLSESGESLMLRQRAHAGFAAEPNHPRAAAIAVLLTFEHFERDEPAVAMGWLMQAQRHLEDQPECVEMGLLALCQAFVSRHTGDSDGALALARRTTELGRTYGDREIMVLGIHAQGLVHVGRGEVAEGMALLDEAMTSVVTGELDPYFTGVIFCNVLDVCLDLADLGRAGEWAEATRAWCETLPPEAPYPAVCRMNRAEVAGMRGDWAEAEAESRRAAEELTYNPLVAARATYETGEIRRRTGNLDGAEEAFARARELGYDPQPGLALLRLAQGKAEAARPALGVSVDAEQGNRLRRARLLSAQVDLAIAVGDLEEAKAASGELDAIARDIGTPALLATAASARGRLRLVRGDVPAALIDLREAAATWRQIRLPYEAAQTRMSYGLALRAAGDEDGAGVELRAALAAFERLGAAPDATATDAHLEGPSDLPRGLTAREAEVLRLLAAGKTNRTMAVDLTISEHTVARHLQNIYAKIGVSSRSAATAFAFEHGLS